MIVDNPAACQTQPCTAPDIIQNPETESQVTYGDGRVPEADGSATFLVHAPVGPIDGWLEDRVSDNSLGAEIHVVLNDHGPVLPEYMPGMIHTYRAGCTDESLPQIFPPSAFADGGAWTQHLQVVSGFHLPAVVALGRCGARAIVGLRIKRDRGGQADPTSGRTRHSVGTAARCARPGLGGDLGGYRGLGTPVYEHVLDRLTIGSGTRVLDCGCGAGRFARLAADRGASIAGIDAAERLIAIAAERTLDGDFRVCDLEALPWPDDSFDVVTGFSSFLFADDKIRALTEARRVSRDRVAVVIPMRVPESGIAAVFRPPFPLFPPEALDGMKHSGMFALSESGKLEDVLAASGLAVEDDDEINCPVGFDDADTAARAFLGAGRMLVAIEHSGEQAIAHAVREALAPFTGTRGRVTLPGPWWPLLSVVTHG